MNILYITAFPPCQKTAGQDYSMRLLNDLISRGHSISLIYAAYPGHNPEIDRRIEIRAVIQPSLIHCIHFPFLHPLFTKRFDTAVLSLIQSIATDFDILYFDFSQVHIYSLFINHSKKILMCHDVICQKFSRMNRMFLLWVKTTEKKLLKTASQVLTFSHKDCSIIETEYGLKAVAVNFYLKNSCFNYIKEKITETTNVFCFYGSWNRKENVKGLEWFFKNVYPDVSDTIQYIVIGGGIDGHLRSKLSAYKNCTILGFIENPVLEIARCQALIAPLFAGAGVKVKVIDALSSGTPVIGTDIAFEGIDDNSNNCLFFKVSADNKKKCAEQFSLYIKNWKYIPKEYKQNAAVEFCSRYNTAHFADMI